MLHTILGLLIVTDVYIHLFSGGYNLHCLHTILGPTCYRCMHSSFRYNKMKMSSSVIYCTQYIDNIKPCNLPSHILEYIITVLYIILPDEYCFFFSHPPSVWEKKYTLKNLKYGPTAASRTACQIIKNKIINKLG